MKTSTLLEPSHFAACAALSLLLAFAVPSRAAESLEQAWAIAIGRDHLLEAAKLREKAAEYGVAEAQAIRMPRIDIEAGYIKLETEPSALVNASLFRNAPIPIAQDSGYFSGISVAVPVFTAGRIGNRIDAANAQADAARAGIRQTQSALKLAVAEAYVAVLRARRMIAASQSHVAAVSKHVEDVRNLLDKGFVTRHDLLATEVALADARQRDLQVANGLALAGSAYNRLLGRNQEGAVDIVDIAETANDDAAIDIQATVGAARSGRPELVQLDMQRDALSKQAAGVSAGVYPQVGVAGGWLKLQNRHAVEDHSWWLGVALKWNVFDGGLIRNQASQISSMARAVAERRADLEEQVELQVRQAALSLNEASARIRLLEQTLSQADETLKLARERYRSGLGPNSEVLDAEARRVQAYANRDNALYDRSLASLRLQYAGGKF